MPLILLVGDDAVLQQTRGAVLRTLGIEIVEADSASAMAVQSTHLFDLLLVCHTVPEEVAAAITRALRTQSAFTPILRIASLAARDWDFSQADGFVSFTSSEPSQLVKRIAEVLGIRGRRHLAA